MKGTNKYVEHWDKDKRDSGNCFRNYNGNYTEREENMENFNFNALLKEMLHRWIWTIRVNENRIFVWGNYE